MGVSAEAVAEAYDAFERGEVASPLSAAAISNQTIQESMRLLLMVRAFQVMGHYAGGWVGTGRVPGSRSGAGRAASRCPALPRRTSPCPRCVPERLLGNATMPASRTGARASGCACLAFPVGAWCSTHAAVDRW